jgi:SAM-dependent methyltransferase
LDSETRGRLRGSFDHAAAGYAASRPGYPDEAVDWLLGAGAHDVLDLGAGSGSLTRPLTLRARRVVAAEPSRNLLTELRAEAGVVPAIQTSAELLPFAGETFDVVTVATAFHWFDAERALPEIARVLRPGGHLALAWNTRALTTSWTQELDDLLRSAQPSTLQGDWGTGSVHALDGSALFDPPEYAAFEHEQRATREGLVGLVASRSYVISLDPPDRDSLLDRVAALLDAHAVQDGTLGLPYRAECWRAAVRRPPHPAP